MKTEQEQIEEMAKQMCGAINNSCIHDCTPACGAREYAERCFKAGYRKASDVIDEFVEKLKAKESPKLLMWEYGEGYLDCIKIAEQLAEEMRQEVEK